MMDVGPVVTGLDWQMNEKVMSQKMTTKESLASNELLNDKESAMQVITRKGDNDFYNT